MKQEKSTHSFFSHQTEKVVHALGKEKLLDVLRSMLLIRNFELRAESAYLQGKIGGFFHSYMGQEAVAAAAYTVVGRDQWWVGSYRCHA
ncbi:MAG: thiamine pyrophosphate-dependent enzyme, partial [Chlamydiales bacterium]